jgi:hypothetical protein
MKSVLIHVLSLSGIVLRLAHFTLVRDFYGRSTVMWWCFFIFLQLHFYTDLLEPSRMFWEGQGFLFLFLGDFANCETAKYELAKSENDRKSNVVIFLNGDLLEKF